MTGIARDRSIAAERMQVSTVTRTRDPLIATGETEPADTTSRAQADDRPSPADRALQVSVANSRHARPVLGAGVGSFMRSGSGSPRDRGLMMNVSRVAGRSVQIVRRAAT